MKDTTDYELAVAATFLLVFSKLFDLISWDWIWVFFPIWFVVGVYLILIILRFLFWLINKLK